MITIFCQRITKFILPLKIAATRSRRLLYILPINTLQKMKINQNEAKKVIEGMLELLLPAWNTEPIRMKGKTLIEVHKQVTDQTGAEIKPQTMYITNKRQKTSKIDHKKALTKLAKTCKSWEVLQDRFAEYLVKYGRRPDRTEDILEQPTA